MTVTVDDNDDAGFTLSGSALTGSTLSVVEGASATLDVRLATQPTGDVTVTLNDGSEHRRRDALQCTSLTFTSTTWNTNQTVTVSAASDDDASDDTATLTISSAGGGYDSVTDATVTVSVDDDDTAGLTLAPTAGLTITEGGTGTFTVQLDTQPTGDVTVALTLDNSEITLSATSLTFTTGTWNTAQTVTATAGEDDDFTRDTTNVTLDSSGGGYDGVADVVYVVTVNDNDADTVPPVVTFMPKDEEVTREAYGNLWLTFDEPTYADASSTPFTNDTAANLVTLTETDADGDAIAFTARAHLTGETAHRRITIIPTDKPLPDGPIHVAVGTGYYDSRGQPGRGGERDLHDRHTGAGRYGLQPGGRVHNQRDLRRHHHRLRRPRLPGQRQGPSTTLRPRRVSLPCGASARPGRTFRSPPGPS